jgi:preprotein translocase subunit SecB
MREKPEKTADAKTKMAWVAEVAARVELQDVHLLSVRAEQNPDLLKAEMKVEFGVSTGIASDREAERITVTANFDAVARPADDEAKSFLRISASFRLVYGCGDLEELSDEKLEAFGSVNGVFNAWPYWREFVQNMTARMGLPPLVLPVFRVSDFAGGSQEIRGSQTAQAGNTE